MLTLDKGSTNEPIIPLLCAGFEHDVDSNRIYIAYAKVGVADGWGGGGVGGGRVGVV